MNAISVVIASTIFSWLMSGILAIPIWVLWSEWGVGARDFGFLPTALQSMSLPDMVAILLLLAVARTAVSPIRLEIKD